tara:strand:+ start:159 stop:914 length:756 start_codon:yes stop_codon:yes gene_type:complete
MKRLFPFLALMTLGISSKAEITTEDVTYKHGSDTMEGFIAYDKAISGKRPVVIIVHQWKGLGDYEKTRARMLAEMGYLAVCADIYGQGNRAQDSQQARTLATKYRSDRKLMRARAQAALDYAKTLELADPAKVAAIGYCFGGGVVLELARSGADLAGVVSFHGNLDTPDPADAKNVACKILVCHGAADGSITMKDVTTFSEEMEAANVDWQLVIYANAKHAFTHFESKDRYNENADKRSWKHMQDFFHELF